MRRESSADTVVIGAGIVGAASAYELARRGRSVVLCEQFELDHVYGSSHGRSRIFRLAYEELDYSLLAQKALPLWRQIEQESGTDLLSTTGGLDVGPRSALEPIASTLSAAGASHQWVNGKEMSERYSWMALPADWEGLLQPDAGVIRARRTVKSLLDLAQRHGAQVYPNTRAVALVELPEGIGVETDEGVIQASQVVVSAGGWAKDLLDPIDLSVPITVTREHVAYYGRPETDNVLPFIWHPEEGGIEYYGLPNLREATVKLGQHGAGPEVDPGGDGHLDPERIRELDEFVATSLPGLRPGAELAETCLYASTPDDDFIIDRSGPVILAVGFGGHGFKFGPAVGSLVADLVEGRDIEFKSRFTRARFQQSTPIGIHAG